MKRELIQAKGQNHWTGFGGPRILGQTLGLAASVLGRKLQFILTRKIGATEVRDVDPSSRRISSCLTACLLPRVQILT